MRFLLAFISVRLLNVAEELLLFSGLNPVESLILFEYSTRRKKTCMLRAEHRLRKKISEKVLAKNK
jgi:hypothetical protein